MMKFSPIGLFLLGLNLIPCFSKAEASTTAWGFGFRSDSSVSNTAGTTVGGNSNYMLGAVVESDWAQEKWSIPFSVRSGGFLTFRSYQYSPVGGSSGVASFTYLEAPVGMQWMMSDFGGPFAGLNFALNLANSCPAGCGTVTSLPLGIQVGLQFKWVTYFNKKAPTSWALALYYESLSPLMVGIDQPKAFVGQGFLYF